MQHGTNTELNMGIWYLNSKREQQIMNNFVLFHINFNNIRETSYVHGYLLIASITSSIS